MNQFSRTGLKKLLVLLVGGTMLLSGCATPSARIADQLGGYGLSPGQSLCVGQRLQANLSLGQLQQLARAAGALTRGDTTPGRFSPSDLYRVASQIEDPKVAIEVARAASACGVLGSFLRR